MRDIITLSSCLHISYNPPFSGTHQSLAIQQVHAQGLDKGGFASTWRASDANAQGSGTLSEAAAAAAAAGAVVAAARHDSTRILPSPLLGPPAALADDVV